MADGLNGCYQANGLVGIHIEERGNESHFLRGMDICVEDDDHIENVADDMVSQNKHIGNPPADDGIGSILVHRRLSIDNIIFGVGERDL